MLKYCCWLSSISKSCSTKHSCETHPQTWFPAMLLLFLLPVNDHTHTVNILMHWNRHSRFCYDLATVCLFAKINYCCWHSSISKSWFSYCWFVCYNQLLLTFIHLKILIYYLLVCYNQLLLPFVHLKIYCWFVCYNQLLLTFIQLKILIYCWFICYNQLLMIIANDWFTVVACETSIRDGWPKSRN